MGSDIWVVMPVYNEKDIRATLKEVQKYTFNIIVVDDGSTQVNYDGLPIEHLIIHKKNYGKGAALRSGCDFAFLKKRAKAVILIDGDGQHDPALIPEFTSKLQDNDVVFGYRNFEQPMPISTQFGNWAITKLMNLLFGCRMKDILSGYRGLTKKAYFKIRWFSNRYKVESDMVINICRKSIKYCEIPIPTIYTRKGNTSKTEGIKILLYILSRRCLDGD